MRLFLLACFAILAALFWAASGGDEFDPPKPAIAAPAPAPSEAAPLPEPAPLTQAAAEPERTVAPADVAAFDRAAEAAETGAPSSVVPETGEAAPSTDAADPIAAALSEALDLRVVTGTLVNVRSGPGTAFEVVAQLAEGQRAEALREEDGWAEVRLEDGTTGWMSARFLE